MKLMIVHNGTYTVRASEMGCCVGGPSSRN